MAMNFRRAREEMHRDIKKSLVENGCDERQADDFATRRADEGMRRAVHVSQEEGTSKPPEL